MEGVSTDKAPSASVVVPHFVVGALGFLTLSVLILRSSASFLGHYYQPELLVITHIAALGWVTMIIFGALYQLIPVVFETALFSEAMAKINLWAFTLGVVLLVYAFGTNSLGALLSWASALTFLSLIMFAVNILLSVRKATRQNYSSRFIVTAVFWLLFTATMGFLLALNHTFTFLDVSNFRFLKIHAHFGILGWFLQLIMGIASVLVPMFLVSHDLDERKLKKAYWLVNIGLTLLVAEWFLNGKGAFKPLSVVLIIAGIVFFLLYLWDAYKNKLRKLDIGMKLTMVAFTAIALPLILGIVLGFHFYTGKGMPQNLSTLYGFTIFFAFITPLILGQTYKTLPFIIWLNRYQLLVGKKKIPMPADLFSTKIAAAHLWTYVGAILFLTTGILASSQFVMTLGASLLVATALLYGINIGIILHHKTSIEALETKQETGSRSLLDLLKTVIDPEVEINIVDMGLIYKLDYDGDKKVDIEMTLSTPNCPIADSIVMNVMETIMNEHPDYDVNVHLVFEPKWTPDLISPAGKLALREGHKWKHQKTA